MDTGGSCRCWQSFANFGRVVPPNPRVSFLSGDCSVSTDPLATLESILVTLGSMCPWCQVALPGKVYWSSPSSRVASPDWNPTSEAPELPSLSVGGETESVSLALKQTQGHQVFPHCLIRFLHLAETILPVVRLQQPEV